ncbi:hypothetical protein EJM73_08800 [Clostridium botulinum]|uniref:hypothetical protein n=1 Tax=Clostridium botulinum TaxID=1491 RepID=UPI001375AEC9|nr:hypothetical protein [Clostridium botulinum]NCI19722.1 hypothetical protein [Clostridium botulinum]NCI35760.1 hypothetical protein [Clostridium botulinum]NCI71617.1 hypothetical protein [Clostridium botulinum]NDI38809.1 hypothetical protein [Clostridium botulinum]
MNLGYGTVEQIELHCPICEKDIYIAKNQNDYACVDMNCPLGHGAKHLIDKINEVLEKTL